MERKSRLLTFLLVFLLGVLGGVLISEYLIPKISPLVFKKEEKVSLKKEGNLEKNQPKKGCQKIKVGKGIEVDLSHQKVRLCEDGEALEEFLVSTGKRENPTPVGTFRVIKKAPMIYSKVANCWLPFWIGFYDDYGFHELPITNEGKRIGEDKIGHPASLGCIRLKTGDAEKLYHFAKIEMKVVIIGETP